MKKSSDQSKSTDRKNSGADSATGRWYFTDYWKPQLSMVLGEEMSKMFS